jgi:hypothetical protein
MPSAADAAGRLLDAPLPVYGTDITRIGSSARRYYS